MSNCYILISKNQHKWNKIFHNKLIFKELTNEHLLRLLLLQKIKFSKKINDNIIIYLDDYELDDFNINSKLISIIKYQSDLYKIYLKDVNQNNLDNKDINRYNKVITRSI